jgi:hypothetical protein
MKEFLKRFGGDFRMFQEKPLSSKLEKAAGQISESASFLNEEVRAKKWKQISATRAEAMGKTNPLADLADMGGPGASKTINAEANFLTALIVFEEQLKKAAATDTRYILVESMWSQTKTENSEATLADLPKICQDFLDKIKALEKF